jgi:hypothetical protein
MIHISSSALGLVPVFSFHFFFRDVQWEVYHLDCKRAVDVLRRHSIVPRISGLFSFFVLTSILVVEVDMPWKDGLEAQYGESFRPWNEEDFQEAINNIIAALPHNNLTTIVSFFSLILFFLGLPFT